MRFGLQPPPIKRAPEPSRTLFASALVEVGEFRCPVTHPQFADTGPTTTHCFVFPREPVWIQHAGDRPFVADPTVVPLYNPGHPYRRSPIGGEGDHTDWFAVSPVVLREVLCSYDRDAADADLALFRFGFARATAATFFTQRQIFRHVKRSPDADRLAVEESVLGVLADVMDALYEPAPSVAHSRYDDQVEAVRAYLARTFACQQGLADVAAAAETSVFHLCRIFKKHTGLTMHRYRSELRLRKSLELVADCGSDCSSDLLSIALELGYSGHSHFTRAFHGAFGVTPSEYRGASRRHQRRPAGHERNPPRATLG